MVAQSCPTLCDPVTVAYQDPPGKDTGVGCHALLQGIFPTQGLHPGLLHGRGILYHLSHRGSPGVGISDHKGTASAVRGRGHMFPRHTFWAMAQVGGWTSPSPPRPSQLCHLGNKETSPVLGQRGFCLGTDSLAVFRGVPPCWTRGSVGGFRLCPTAPMAPRSGPRAASSRNACSLSLLCGPEERAGLRPGVHGQ